MRQDMDIKILGPGCSNCVKLEKVTRQVVEEMGIVATIEKVEDYEAIASFGVMSTPALVINGAVVIYGRVPTPRHIRELIESASRI